MENMEQIYFYKKRHKCLGTNHSKLLIKIIINKTIFIILINYNDNNNKSLIKKNNNKTMVNMKIFNKRQTYF